ncbi:Gas vesicle G [Desulfofarcimen acetoxidans DSM 771]|uniref:Gas vesicle G n=1 Tax=Desulfofarcimen acetoxidans (strain ATCC 49208 / DSM 771 / KCTC 5769 / VKM B-1644 / 5575) TaxID=485916 RepID=C8W3J3_DESAS|nr:gas vesicle protein GvpG [Desulfofarcimen acetoxidans]ACV63779.1 Gas vesicle G [Desulfofarcimen acetoxidans DSM 771]
MLGKLLLSPILGPVMGVKFIAEKIKQQADQELYDKSKIKQDLMELQIKLELEEITEEYYLQREEELLVRLDELASMETEEEEV